MKKLLSLFFAFVMLFSFVYSEHVNWSVPTILCKGDFSTLNEQKAIAVDPNGNVVAAWIDNKQLQFCTKLSDQDWGPITVISEKNTESVRIVMDNDGNTTVIWVEQGIKTATKPLYGEWSDIITLSSSDLSKNPCLAIGSEGDVVAAWEKNGNIETSTKLFGYNWRPALTLNSSIASNPKIQIGGSSTNEKAILVWEGASNNSSVVFVSSKLIKGNWSNPKVISNFENVAYKPNVAMDKNGNAIAIWYDGKDYNWKIKSSTFSARTGTWSRVENLSLPGTMHNSKDLKACVKFDAEGNAIATWITSFNVKTWTLQSAVKLINGEWTQPKDVVSTNTYLFSGDLAVAEGGKALCIYMCDCEKSLTIRSVETNIKDFQHTSWSQPISVSTGNENAFPELAISSSDDLIHTAAIWFSFDGVKLQLESSLGSCVKDD